jgi:hypothetical protein
LNEESFAQSYIDDADHTFTVPYYGACEVDADETSMTSLSEECASTPDKVKPLSSIQLIYGDGGMDLVDFIHSRKTLVDVMDILSGLTPIITGLARRAGKLFHGDIKFNNVVIQHESRADGLQHARCRLIDWGTMDHMRSVFQHVKPGMALTALSSLMGPRYMPADVFLYAIAALDETTYTLAKQSTTFQPLLYFNTSVKAMVEHRAMSASDYYKYSSTARAFTPEMCELYMTEAYVMYKSKLIGRELDQRTLFDEFLQTNAIDVYGIGNLYFSWIAALHMLPPSQLPTATTESGRKALAIRGKVIDVTIHKWKMLHPNPFMRWTLQDVATFHGELMAILQQ